MLFQCNSLFFQSYLGLILASKMAPLTRLAGSWLAVLSFCHALDPKWPLRWLNAAHTYSWLACELNTYTHTPTDTDTHTLEVRYSTWRLKRQKPCCVWCRRLSQVAFLRHQSQFTWEELWSWRTNKSAVATPETYSPKREKKRDNAFFLGIPFACTLQPSNLALVTAVGSSIKASKRHLSSCWMRHDWTSEIFLFLNGLLDAILLGCLSASDKRRQSGWRSVFPSRNDIDASTVVAVPILLSNNNSTFTSHYCLREGPCGAGRGDKTVDSPQARSVPVTVPSILIPTNSTGRTADPVALWLHSSLFMSPLCLACFIRSHRDFYGRDFAFHLTLADEICVGKGFTDCGRIDIFIYVCVCVCVCVCVRYGTTQSYRKESPEWESSIKLTLLH